LKRWEAKPARRPDGLASSKEEEAKPFSSEDPEVLACTFRKGRMRKKREGKEKVKETFSKAKRREKPERL
jgi:hypothetical protein